MKEDQKEGDDKETLKDGLFDFLKDIVIAVIIVAVIIGSIYAYSGIWPPLVVIDSGSMKHGEESQVGAIDAGDLVLVKEIDDRNDVITYIEGRADGHRTYGDYGDVIIFS